MGGKIFTHTLHIGWLECVWKVITGNLLIYRLFRSFSTSKTALKQPLLANSAVPIKESLMKLFYRIISNLAAVNNYQCCCLKEPPSVSMHSVVRPERLRLQ